MDPRKKKEAILLTGKTGVGKTELMRLIAKYLDKPFYKVDTTQLTIPGYVGKDIEEVYSLYSTNTISELTESIIHAIDNPTGMMQLTNRINSMYQDFSIANTCFSENVVRVLEKIDHRSYICEK